MVIAGVATYSLETKEMPGADAAAVANYRRRRKIKLVALFGGKCYDCKQSFPPYVFDFDHRDPSEKCFAIGNNGSTLSWERTLEEAKKCDMVCANCHRVRTHGQRCPGCEFCQ